MIACLLTYLPSRRPSLGWPCFHYSPIHPLSCNCFTSWNFKSLFFHSPLAEYGLFSKCLLCPFFSRDYFYFWNEKKSPLYLSISCFHNLLVVHSHIETICPLYLPMSSLSMYLDITIVIGVVIFFFPIYPVSIFRPDLLYIIIIWDSSKILFLDFSKSDKYSIGLIGYDHKFTT